MNEFDPTLALELDGLAPRNAASADWNDVLARSGHRPRRAPVLILAAALACVALFATPAFGIRGQVGELLGIWHPSSGLVATLKPVAGSGSGTVVVAPVRPFTPIGSMRRVFARALEVTVTYDGLSGPAIAGRIRVAPPRGSSAGGYVVRLCGPCRTGTTVSIQRRGLFLALLAGRGTVEIATKAHPKGELRGRLHPS